MGLKRDRRRQRRQCQAAGNRTALMDPTWQRRQSAGQCTGRQALGREPARRCARWGLLTRSRQLHGASHQPKPSPPRASASAALADEKCAALPLGGIEGGLGRGQGIIGA